VRPYYDCFGDRGDDLQPTGLVLRSSWKAGRWWQSDRPTFFIDASGLLVARGRRGEFVLFPSIIISGLSYLYILPSTTIHYWPELMKEKKE
jgi:hypothetical protein